MFPKEEELTPKKSTTPNPELSPEKPKSTHKRMREPSTPSDTDTSNSSESESDPEDFDFSNPSDCADYFKSLIGTSLKISSSTQKSLKLLKRTHKEKMKRKLVHIRQL